MLPHYPRTANIYERQARLFGQLYKTTLGILQRDRLYYPYIEDTRVASASIEGLGRQGEVLQVAFARRDEMGWSTGMLHADRNGYLYATDAQQARSWLDTRIATQCS
jgi:hypothetical protein